jgi:predicted ArsR family transcriptional regulator
MSAARISDDDVLRELADRQGHTVQQLAGDLTVSPATVRRHLNDLMKLGLVRRGTLHRGTWLHVGGYRYAITDLGAGAYQTCEAW